MNHARLSLMKRSPFDHAREARSVVEVDLLRHSMRARLPAPRSMYSSSSRMPPDHPLLEREAFC